MTWIYTGLAVAVGLVVLAIAAQKTLGSQPADRRGSEPLPATPLQKRARIAVVCGALTMIGLVAVS